MDIILFLLTIASLVTVIGILLVFFLKEKEQQIELQKEYLKQLKDMNDKIYFRKPEEFTQNKVIEKPDMVNQNNEEQMIPFDQAPMDEVMKALNMKVK
jgi:hypothetical protein